MIVCKVCGATNEQGATFCGTCGSFLEWSGEAVQPDGSTQPQAAADGPPPGPTGPSGRPRGRVDRRHDRDRHAHRRDCGDGPAGLDHLSQLRPGQRPDPRLLLALRHRARPGRRGERPGRRRAAHVAQHPAGRDRGRHRRGRPARDPRLRPAAQGIAGAVVRGRGHRGAVRRRREQPALDRGERIARGVRVGRGRVAVAERGGSRRHPRSRRAGSRSRRARTATPT